MDNTLIQSLLENLKDPDESVRDAATHELWRLWFTQKGAKGLEMLERSQSMIDAGEFGPAEQLLTEVITDLPDFAEAWNRRAVLHYICGQYHKSLADCDQALVLNPIHFGALHGQGLCHMALKQYMAAIQSFRQALEIQPYALENQKMILECTARLI
ncbi:MAG: hypothetical protein Fur0046_16160 [Cyanobacteria bacterium J069]